MGACRVMHEKKKKNGFQPEKTFKISKITSPKTPDTVKRPYKHNDTDLWDRGSYIYQRTYLVQFIHMIQI